MHVQSSSLTDEGAVERVADGLRRCAVTDIICTVGFVPTYMYEDDKAAAERVDFEGTVALIRAAEQAALPGRFVLVSSLLATLPFENASSRGLNLLGRVLDQKRAAEEALRASRLDWCIVRPGVLAPRQQAATLVYGGENTFTADRDRDRAALANLGYAAEGPPVKCASPFVGSAGVVCGISRVQLAGVCVDALEDSLRFSRKIVEVVARP